jgi:hypothetical protein
MLLCSVMLSCCKEAPKKYNAPTSKAAQKVESENKNSENSGLLWDVDGVIVTKHYVETRNDYFFTVKLTSNGKVFDWEVNRAKYSSKEVGDAVHFEYIRKDRFSDKALN